MVGTDCLVDTNIILRSADRLHPSSTRARDSMKILFRQGIRLCVAKQSLLEAWVVATRPRNASAAGGLSKVKRLFHVLADTDSVYPEWERLALANQVVGKTAYHARLVPVMNTHSMRSTLTFNTDAFRRYREIVVVHPA